MPSISGLEVSMLKVGYLRTLGVLSLLSAFGTLSANAQEIKTVFVIAMENHNWTQPNNQVHRRNSTDLSES